MTSTHFCNWALWHCYDYFLLFSLLPNLLFVHAMPLLGCHYREAQHPSSRLMSFVASGVGIEGDDIASSWFLLQDQNHFIAGWWWSVPIVAPSWWIWSTYFESCAKIWLLFFRSMGNIPFLDEFINIRISWRTTEPLHRLSAYLGIFSCPLWICYTRV